jgi:hypothetical protein
MSISVACPGCKSVMTVPDSAAGRSGTCRKCGTRVHVPEAEPQIMFDTPALEHTERAAQLRRPIAAPTRADAVAELYAEVPFYRRNGPVSALAISGVFIFFTAIAAAVIVLTGPVYRPILDHSGRLVKWGPGNRYAAVVIVAVWAVIIVYKIKMG